MSDQAGSVKRIKPKRQGIHHPKELCCRISPEKREPLVSQWQRSTEHLPFALDSSLLSSCKKPPVLSPSAFILSLKWDSSIPIEGDVPDNRRWYIPSVPLSLGRESRSVVGDV
jgi:hypothetical protein